MSHKGQKRQCSDRAEHFRLPSRPDICASAGPVATTFVKPTSSSSPSVKPVKFLPSTNGLPRGVFTWRNTPGAWHTSAMGLPAVMKDSIRLTEFLSSARSHIGPWPSKVGAEFGLVAFGVERGTTVSRGRERDLGAGVLEDIVGSRELLEPEAGLASRISELVVRRENHQHFHDPLHSLMPIADSPTGSADRSFAQTSGKHPLTVVSAC